MARLSDVIEDFIKQMMDDNNESELQIVRNELANYFSCAPSQINYVLTTRFTADKGYYVESRRGGGGCIIIRKVELNDNQSLSEIINDKIGDNITYNSALRIISGLFESEIITKREFYILKAVINDRTLSSFQENKNLLRANILKSAMLVLLSDI
ncbi:CtsR family transcriptional regulator [Clostridium fermenticellae]|uniref:Transcriptional regulator CtsR n=1 Tax=Clostridium fermenticellae TaxID=2068654 RepID=A0A386H0Y9_9CLOT|nr:CtsR family transcriptional regulator [Clostridium fermenticellae]AYD39223.1 CtsR family transcriptional regulator [Clostridium fermenticellae]